MSAQIQRFEDLKAQRIAALAQYEEDYLGSMDVDLSALKALRDASKVEMEAMLKDSSFCREYRAYVLKRNGAR